MGMIWNQTCVLFFGYMHSFQRRWFEYFGNFLHIHVHNVYVHYKTFFGFALSVSAQRLFIPHLGHLLWRLQSKRGLAFNEERQKYSHYQLMLIPSLTASFTKDVPDME